MQNKFGPESVWVYQILRSVLLGQLVLTRSTAEVYFDRGVDTTEGT